MNNNKPMHVSINSIFLRPWASIFYLFYFLKILFISRGDGREKNINVWLPVMLPQPGTWPTTKACALTGNRTSDPLVCRLALNPLSQISQGGLLFFIILFLEGGKGSEKEMERNINMLPHMHPDWGPNPKPMHVP